MSDTESSSYAEGDVETGVGATMIALMVISVGLRFYARIHLKTGLGWDDWFALAGLVAATVAALLVLCASVVDPNSSWIENNTDPSYQYTHANKIHLKLAWVSSIFYFSLVAAAKLSILLLYHRIFAAKSLSFHRLVAALATLIVLFWAATTFATIFTCWPMQWSWISSLSPAPYCFNFNIFWFVTGLIEALLDVCLITLPVRMVVRLQMSLRKRISLVAVFSLGIFGIVTGLIKVYYGYAPGQRSPRWNQTETWSAVHGGMGILCSCLPVCWPLFLKSLSKIHPPSSLSRPRSSVSTPRSASWWRHKLSHSWDSSTTRNTRQVDTATATATARRGPENAPTGARDASDVELPMLSPAQVSGAGGGGCCSGVNANQQAWIWSLGRRSSGGDSEEHLGRGIQVDRTFSRTSDSAGQDTPYGWV